VKLRELEPEAWFFIDHFGSEIQYYLKEFEKDSPIAKCKKVESDGKEKDVLVHTSCTITVL